MQHVGALGISHVLVGSFGTRRDQTGSHPEGPGIVGSDAEVIFLEDALAEPLPEFNVILSPVASDALLQKQPGGKFREAF